jgi:transposase
MRKPVLDEIELQKAKFLKGKGATKRELASLFNVGQSTIWDNVFRKVTIHTEIQEKCSRCEIRLKKEVVIENGIKKLPFNYKLGDKCLDCVLELKGVSWEELQAFGIKIHT